MRYSPRSPSTSLLSPSRFRSSGAGPSSSTSNSNSTPSTSTSNSTPSSNGGAPSCLVHDSPIHNLDTTCNYDFWNSNNGKMLHTGGFTRTGSLQGKGRYVKKYPEVPMGTCTICFDPMDRYSSTRPLVRWGCGLHYTHWACYKQMVDAASSHSNSHTVDCPVCRTPTPKTIFAANNLPSAEETIRMIDTLPPSVHTIKYVNGAVHFKPDENPNEERVVYIENFERFDQLTKLVNVLVSKPHIATVYSHDMRAHPIQKVTTFGKFSPTTIRNRLVDTLTLMRALDAPPLPNDVYGAHGVTIHIGQMKFPENYKMLFKVLEKYNNVIRHLKFTKINNKHIMDRVAFAFTRNGLRSVTIEEECETPEAFFLQLSMLTSLKVLNIQGRSWTSSMLRNIDAIVRNNELTTLVILHNNKLFDDPRETGGFFNGLLYKKVKVANVFILIKEEYVKPYVREQCDSLGYVLASSIPFSGPFSLSKIRNKEPSVRRQKKAASPRKTSATPRKRAISKKKSKSPSRE